MADDTEEAVMSDERRAEIEAVRDVLRDALAQYGIQDPLPLAERVVDRVRDARGDDEAARLDDERVALALEVGELRAKLKRAEAARSPQGEDHEAGIEALRPFIVGALREARAAISATPAATRENARALRLVDDALGRLDRLRDARGDDEAAGWRSMLERIRVHGASGLWDGEDCAIGAVAALEGSDAGRAFMLEREAARSPQGEDHEVDDGILHLWECPHVLNGDNPDFERCGFIARGDKGTPGFCPYDHGDRVQLVPLVATVLCSDCAIPILRDDCRADDGRLVCGDCAMSYIETETEG